MRALIFREAKLMSQSSAIYLAAITFYGLFLGLFPFLVTMPENATHVAALLWFAMIMSFLTVLPHVFKSDLVSGVLDQIKLQQQDLSSYIFCKGFSIWCGTFLPMIMLLPMIKLFYVLDWQQVACLSMAIAAGGICMVAMGLLLMSIAIGLETQQALIAVMYLPLLVPVMIAGALSLDSEMGLGALQLLVGSALLSLAFVPSIVNYLLNAMYYE